MPGSGANELCEQYAHNVVSVRLVRVGFRYGLRWTPAVLASAVLWLAVSNARAVPGPVTGSSVPSAPSASPSEPSPTVGDQLPGMPPVLDPNDLYAADRPNALSDAVRSDPQRVYVPNNGSASVSVIDPATFKVIATVPVAQSPEHVVPSWNLRTLWVNSDIGNTLTPIDAATGQFGTPVPVDDPYNLYFTPDGKYAIVMAEAAHQIVFRDPNTMAIAKIVPVPCDGVNHADFSPDGRYFIASCEFSGDLLKVDVAKQEIIGTIHLPGLHAMPQDVRISPDGKTWYIADMQTSGVWLVNGDAFTVMSFLPTGAGAHGLYISRDSKHLYITNRGEGSVSVLDFATNALVAKWQIPGGGSPDMGGLSADGKVLWLSGRYDGVVYAIDTTDGHLIAKIPVGANPHGLCVWPQPGRYSLGHTSNLR
jgi:YVTN family beta-propeller protein